MRQIFFFACFRFAMMVSGVAILALIGCLSGCDSSEATCTSYFLKESRLANEITSVSYNNNGLIDKLIETSRNVNTYSFNYNSNNEIEEVTATDGFHGEFNYNNLGQLESCFTYYNTAPDQHNEFRFYYDGNGRLIKRELYFGVGDPVSFYTLEYPDSKTVKAQLHQQDGQTSKPLDLFTYTLDDKRLPYPDEYYILYLGLGNLVTPYNQVSIEISRDGVVSSFTSFLFEYNDGGYPVKQDERTFTYSCGL